MPIRDLNEFKSTSGDGFETINDYHLNTTTDVVENLLKKPYGTDYNSIANEHTFSPITASSAKGYLDMDIESAIKIEKPDLKELSIGTNLCDPDEMLKNRFGRFTRYGYLDLSGEFLTGTREYLFFSKPDLHLMNEDGTMNAELESNPFLCEAYKHYRYSYYSLQQWFGGSKEISGDSSVGTVTEDSTACFDINSKYIQLLSNMATSTLDLGDITASEVENNKNLYGIGTTYREGSLMSDIGYDFSIEFKDTKYLDVYMLFKIYDEYNRHKYFEEVTPNREEYILSRIYPEAISIWKLIVDDTDRIIYWAKATGCVPMNVPRASLSNLEGIIKFTVNWKAHFITEMNPIHLSEINNLTRWSLSKNVSARSLIDTNTWVGYPYILPGGNDTGLNTPMRSGDYSATPEQHFYKLLWCK